MTRILITGANGFVGKKLCEKLSLNKDLKIRGAVRKTRKAQPGIEDVIVGNLTANTDWSLALDGVDVVVHLVALTHINKNSRVHPLEEYRLVNVLITKNLAQQAHKMGVKRFIFISSIKVNGERTENGQSFSSDDKPNPQSFYGVSKYEAEQFLLRFCNKRKMKVVIIRPPLIYGPGVKGNLKWLLDWFKKGLPIPLLAFNKNKRSFLFLDNLIDLIDICLRNSSAENKIFLASDGEDISTATFLKLISAVLGKSYSLFYLPPKILRFIATLTKNKDAYEKLHQSLQIDISNTKKTLNWTPPVKVEDAIKCFRNEQRT